MQIVISKVRPEHVAGLLDAIRQHRIPDLSPSSQPSNWYESIEVRPEEHKPAGPTGG